MEQHTSLSQSLSSSPGTQPTQADLVRMSVTATKSFPHGRRYALGRDAVHVIRDQVNSATLEACTREGCTPESVSAAAADAAERAVFYVGVERLA